jgi:hypothetical protein
LTTNAMSANDVFGMVKRRAAEAGLPRTICCHVPGHGHHGLPGEGGHGRARAADCGARVAPDNETL